jgi:putative hemolysin
LDFHLAISIFFNFSFLAMLPALSGILIFVAIFLFIISFMMAGGQVAFFALSPKDINVLKTRSNPSYRRIVSMLEQPKTLLASMLITNTLVNMGIILVSNILISDWIEPYNFTFWPKFILKVIVVTLLLLVFGEILPKVWATHNKLRFAAFSSLLIEIFNTTFYIISKRFVKFSDRLEKNLSPEKNNLQDSQHIDEAIDLLSEEAASKEEKQILKGIRKFGDTSVKQIMRTRLDVSGIEISTNFIQLKSIVEDLHYSRLPVYKNNLDEIVGVLHTKDLLPQIDDDENYDWRTLIRTPYFVHEKKHIEDLLQEFRKKQMHFAVVVDEFGGTSGIVTLEDIMEEIIGEIKDEFDDEETINKKIDDNTYIFEGKIMINDACKAMEISIDTFDSIRGESDSLAGLLLEIAGEFPQINEVLQSGDFDFIPLEINKNRIDKVKVIIKPQAQ